VTDELEKQARELAEKLVLPVMATPERMERVSESRNRRVNEVAELLASFAAQVRERSIAECGHSCGQGERDKRLIEGIENTSITYYGPHPCDLCGKKSIVMGSVKQGFGDLRFEYPPDIIYPNHNWTLHRCVTSQGQDTEHDTKKENTMSNELLELVLDEMPDAFRREPGTAVDKMRAFVKFYQATVAELQAAYNEIPDSLNRSLIVRIQGLANRADRESLLAVKLRNRLEEIQPGSGSDI